MLQQSSSLPDLSKGATSEQSPAGESPSPATSEPGPGPQDHQAWGVLRPTPQRIGAFLDHQPLQAIACPDATARVSRTCMHCPSAKAKVYAWLSACGKGGGAMQAAMAPLMLCRQ